MPSIRELMTLVGKDNVLFEHEGAVSKELLLDTLPTIEQVLESRGIARPTRRKVVSIAIECLQNLQLHGTDAEVIGKARPTFFITESPTAISVLTGNTVNPDQIPYLKDKLLKINSLTEDEIKYLYTVIMRQTVVKFSAKGGAGLGLVDMKKKSGNNLSYDFKDIDKDTAYFSLKVSVPRREIEE